MIPRPDVSSAPSSKIFPPTKAARQFGGDRSGQELAPMCGFGFAEKARPAEGIRRTIPGNCHCFGGDLINLIKNNSIRQLLMFHYPFLPGRMPKIPNNPPHQRGTFREGIFFCRAHFFFFQAKHHVLAYNFPVG